MIEVKNVSYEYIKNHPVLDDISMTFEQGKTYAIFGPSGCGKTTLLSLLGALDAPTSGAVLFDGKDIAQIGDENHRKDNVAFIF